LTMADPSAFGFSRPNPASIQVNGTQFQDPNLQTLGLIGGDVTITGEALLQAENVQIFSVRSAGEATLRLPNATNGLTRAAINAENFTQHGAISINGPNLDSALSEHRAAVQAQRVVIRGGTLALRNTTMTAFTNGPGDGVQIKTTSSLEMTERSVIQAANFGDMADRTAVDITAGSLIVGHISQISTQTGPDGAGGDLRLTIQGALRASDGGAIVTDSYSLIRGGNLAISADSIALERSGAIVSTSNDIGKAGDISLNVAGRLSLMSGSKVSIHPANAAGEVLSATAGEILISGEGSGFLFHDLAPGGIGGAIILNSRGLLSIEDGGFVSAVTVGRDGASVNIHAANVRISGEGVSDGVDTGITALSAGDPGTRGGEIRMTIDGTLSVLDGGVITTDANNGGNGGNIDITASDVIVTGRGGALSDRTLGARGITARNLSTDPARQGGSSGNVRLTLSGRLEVRDAGEILVDTSGTGAGGNIAIRSREVKIENLGTVAARSLADKNGGPGGNVSFDVSGLLAVGPQGVISVSTSSSGAAGAIDIRGGAVQVSGTGARITAVSGAPDIRSTGSGGEINLDVKQLTLLDNGQITASTYGSGPGGNVRIKADSVRIQDSGGSDFAGISAQTFSPLSGGPGGSILIDTKAFVMRGSGAEVTTQSFGSGAAGKIQITARTISMDDGSSIQSSSIGAGNAGSITINAKGNITLDHGSSLSVDSSQSDAGDIRVRSTSSITLTDSSITAQAALNGGSIDLRARDLLFLTNSQITAAAGLNGGNIFIDPIFVILDESLISANAIRGRGGNVRIISDFFFAPIGSAVTATSKLGIDGTVRIDTLNNDLVGSLVELPSSLLDAESLLRELCSVKIDNFSSFISEGRGGLPPLPGEALPSFMIVR
jgi:large exoprotein involved in heme utilization and adhesion